MPVWLMVILGLLVAAAVVLLSLGCMIGFFFMRLFLEMMSGNER